MKSGTFIAEFEENGKISIPMEIIERLNLSAGDKIEILLKKIRSRRFELTIPKNPLVKILDLTEVKDK